jgi:hypothetical protein
MTKLISYYFHLLKCDNFHEIGRWHWHFSHISLTSSDSSLYFEVISFPHPKKIKSRDNLIFLRFLVIPLLDSWNEKEWKHILSLHISTSLENVFFFLNLFYLKYFLISSTLQIYLFIFANISRNFCFLSLFILIIYSYCWTIEKDQQTWTGIRKKIRIRHKRFRLEKIWSKLHRTIESSRPQWIENGAPKFYFGPFFFYLWLCFIFDFVEIGVSMGNQIKIFLLSYLYKIIFI